MSAAVKTATSVKSSRVAMWPASGPSDTVLAFPCASGYGCCASATLWQIVVSDSEDAMLHVYDLESGAHIRSLDVTPAKFHIGPIAFGPRGDTVMLGEDHGDQVSEIRISDGACVAVHGKGVLYRPELLDCDFPTETLVLGSPSNVTSTVTLFDLRSGTIKWQFSQYVSYASLQFVDNGKAVAFRGVNKDIVRISCATGRPLNESERGPSFTFGACVNDGSGWICINWEALTIGPFYAKSKERRKSYWKQDGFTPHKIVKPVQDRLGMLVVVGHDIKKRGSICVLRNRDLRWAWVTLMAHMQASADEWL